METFEVGNLTKPRVEDRQRVEERAVQHWLGQEQMRFLEVLVQGSVVGEGVVDAAGEG